jgi:hypothetical protein
LQVQAIFLHESLFNADWLMNAWAMSGVSYNSFLSTFCLDEKSGGCHKRSAYASGAMHNNHPLLIRTMHFVSNSSYELLSSLLFLKVHFLLVALGATSCRSGIPFRLRYCTAMLETNTE